MQGTGTAPLEEELDMLGISSPTSREAQPSRAHDAANNDFFSATPAALRQAASPDIEAMFGNAPRPAQPQVHYRSTCSIHFMDEIAEK